MLALLLALIVDGDTLILNGQSYRLQGIDAPELKQTCQNASQKPYNCGTEAKQHLSDLTQQKQVNCVPTGDKSYKRLIATCYADGQDLSKQMVKDGQATSYKFFSHKYDKEETEAKLNKRGIWAGTFTEPYQWRKTHE